MPFDIHSWLSTFNPKKCNCPYDPQNITREYEAVCFGTAHQNAYQMGMSAGILIREQISIREDLDKKLNKVEEEAAATFSDYSGRMKELQAGIDAALADEYRITTACNDMHKW